MTSVPEPRQTLRAVLFDLDGVLADTEPLHFRAHRQTLKARGYDLTEQEHDDHWIRCGKGLPEFLRDHDIRADASVMRLEKDAAFLNLLATRDVSRPGVRELVQELRSCYRIAVCTSSRRHIAEAILKSVNLRELVDVLVTADDVKERKPAPDVFLEAARKLDVRTSECVVVEDALKGIRAALAARMPVLLICEGHPVRGCPAGDCDGLTRAEIEAAFAKGAVTKHGSTK